MCLNVYTCPSASACVCVRVWQVYLEACEAVVEWWEWVDIRLPA